MADQWNSNTVEEGESYEMVSRSSTKMKIRRVKNKKQKVATVVEEVVEKVAKKPINKKENLTESQILGILDSDSSMEEEMSEMEEETM